MKIDVYRIITLLANAKCKAEAVSLLDKHFRQVISHPTPNRFWLDRKHSTLYDGSGNIIYVGEEFLLVRTNSRQSEWCRTICLDKISNEDSGA